MSDPGVVLHRLTAVDNAGDDGNLVRASPTRVAWLDIYNGDSSVSFVHLYDVDVSAAVTPGTTVPTATWAIPAESPRLIPVNARYANGVLLCMSGALDGSGSAPSSSVVMVARQ